MTVHDRTRLIGQFHLLKNPASAGFLLFLANNNSWPRHLRRPDKARAAIRQWMQMPDGAALIGPTNGFDAGLFSRSL